MSGSCAFEPTLDVAAQFYADLENTDLRPGSKPDALVPCSNSVQVQALCVGRTTLGIIQIFKYLLAVFHCIFMSFKAKLHDGYTLNFQVLLLLRPVFGSAERPIGVFTIHHLSVF